MAALPLYKRNLIVLWFGNFFVGIGLSLLVAFIPLFVDTLGTFSRQELSFFSGAVVAAPFLSQAIISPFWGRLADRKGRKVMLLRASLGMSLFMFATGFVTNVWILILVRALFGVFSGFISNSVALIAVQVPKRESGKVLGMLNTSNVSGTLLGPIFGGLMVPLIGYAGIFFFYGGLLAVVFVLTWVFVKESFTPVAKGQQDSTKQVFAKIEHPKIVFNMFLTTLLVRITLTSINPILSLYVRDILPAGENVELWSGIVAAAPGLTTVLASSFLGTLGDRIGAPKVLLCGLFITILALLPMAFVTNVWQIVALRLLFGIANAALTPSIQTILIRNTPREVMSLIFAYNQSAMSAGMVGGPLVGAAVGGILDVRYVFFASTVFTVFNVFSTLYVDRKAKRENREAER